jgi:ABC-type lipoprotein release transport system permease subunit
MSWRNIWRNKVRSLVVIFAIAIGLIGGIFIAGLSNGMVAQQTDNAINNEISNAQIHNPKFLDNMSPKFLIENVDEKIDQIRRQPNVTEVCYRTKATAMASTAATGAGVTLNGIIPEEEKKVTDIYSKVIEGNYFEKESKTAQILIGQKLAHKLKTKLGNKIVITVQALNGEMTYALFRVAGIFKTNNTGFDELNVFVRSADLNPTLGIMPGQANEIAIRTTDLEAAFAVVDQLKTEFPGLSVQSWRDIRPSLILMMTMMDQFSYWLMIIILFALIFGIINTMLMVILERKRELGMLMAVGMNKKRVFRMILIETTLLSLTGGLIGLIISMVMVGILSKTGINFASWAEGLEAMGYSAYIYPEISSEFYVVVTILVILTAVIASIWPTRKALKLNPADAIRSE